jgi:hypothetical protein
MTRASSTTKNIQAPLKFMYETGETKLFQAF